MASVFSDFLDEWDIFGTTGCLPKQRGILLVDNLQGLGKNVSARQLVAAGISSKLCANDFMQCEDEHMLGSISLIWDTNWYKPLEQEKTFFVNARDAHFCHDRFPDSPDFIIDEKTVVIPCVEKQTGPIRVLELFAGGYGGWACALRVLKHQGNPAQIVALDHDLDACKSYAISHGAVLVNGMRVLDSKIFVDTNLDFIVHADVTDQHWLRPLGFWSPEVMVVSSPCPPWSHASSGAGLESSEGSLMMKSIAIAKILRPRTILLEQVNGFNDHPHKTYLVRLFRWAGYSLHWAKVIDAAAWCGTSRKRWLAMLIKIGDEKILPMPFEMWPYVFQFPTPASLDAVLQPDLVLDDRLQIRGVALDRCTRHDLLPPNKRPKVSQADVLSSRSVTKKQQVPTFMASYGSQHEFSLDFLKQKGLMAHFLHTDLGTTRYWHPIEILFLHCGVGFNFIPANWKHSWKYLGNQICVPHALLLLANAFRMMPARCIQCSVESSFQQLLKLRLTAGSCFISAIDVGHFVSDQPISLSDQEIQAVKSLVQDNFVISSGECWLLSKGGFCERENLSRIDGPSVEDRNDNLNPDDLIDEHLATQVSNVSDLDLNDRISPTISFMPIVKGLIHFPSTCLSFWTVANLPPSALENLWGLSLCLSFDFPDDVEHTFHLVPCSKQVGSEYQVGILCLFQDRCLTTLLNCRSTWEDISGNGADKLYDAFGELHQLPTDETLVIFTTSPLASFVPPEVNSLAVFAASTLANAFWHFDSQTMKIQLVFQGAAECVNTLLVFWGSSLAEIGLSELGWTFESQNNCGFVFSHVGPNCPIPPQALWTLIVVATFRTLVSALSLPNGRCVKLKWLSRPVWFGPLPLCLPLSVLTKALQCIAVPTLEKKSLPLRLVHQGRNISIEQTIGDCTPKDGQVTLHFVSELLGGAPATSSRTGFQTQVRNAIASTLLQEGFELKWVTSVIEQAVDRIGFKALAPIAAKAHGAQRFTAVKEALVNANIEIPLVKPTVSSAAALRSKAKKKAPTAPDAKNYKAIPGYLLNEDGTQASQLWELRNGISGFYLATPDVALPWLRSNDVISSDELALVVFGDPPCSTNLAHSQVTLPCKDEQDRDVLIAANLFQLGQKKVTFREFDKHVIDVATTSLVALTLWKDDWVADWDQIVKHTFAHIRNTFQLDEAIVSIWGRSFRKGRSNTSPNDATSCQVHCTIKEGSLVKFLQASGVNLIWATPKTQEGRPSQLFRLLWLKPEVAFSEAVVLCAKIRGSLGLHRSKDKLAIRVARADFPAAWKELYPHDDLPCDVEAAHMFKLEVLPFGTTASTLLEWAQHIKWPLKPIRALGPRSWLVGSPSVPPDSLHFNGSPVLARALLPRTQHAPSPIIAGPQPSIAAPVAQSGLVVDPWAAWTGPRPTAPSGVAPTRVPTGPVESKLNEQNDRIVKLESSITQLQTEQSKHSITLQKTNDEIRTRDQQLRSHMDTRLGEIRKELDATFTSALQQQSKTFESGMLELKSLLTQGKAKRKSDHDDMET